MSNLKNVTDAGFEQDVLKSAKPVMVDFWAPWCGPCRAVGPTLEQIAQERGDTLDIVKLNVDENPETAAKFGIRGIPAFIMFRDGKIIGQNSGVQPRGKLLEWIDTTLGNSNTPAVSPEEFKKAVEEKEDQAQKALTRRVEKVTTAIKTLSVAFNAVSLAGGLTLAAAALTTPVLIVPFALGTAAAVAGAAGIYKSLTLSPNKKDGAGLSAQIAAGESDGKILRGLYTQAAIGGGLNAAKLGAGVLLVGTGGILTPIGIIMTLMGGFGLAVSGVATLTLPKALKTLREEEAKKQLPPPPASP